MGKASRNKAERGAAGGDRQAKIQAAAPKGRMGGNGFIIGTAVAVLAIIAVVVGTLVLTQDDRAAKVAGGSAIPANASGMGDPIVVNADVEGVDDAPVLDVYQDYQCPICKQFEDTYGSTIDQLATSGKIKYQIHMLSFLDGNLGNDASNRAANAAACVDDAGAGLFSTFNQTIYAGQPANEGDGYTDEVLKGFAETAGVSGDALSTWQTCYDDRSHNQYVESIADQAAKDGINGTPTVKLNGETIELNDLGGPDGLTAMVTAAAK